MVSTLSEFAVWGSGLAGLAYLLFFIYIFFAWRGGLAGGALLTAVAGSAVWGGMGVLPAYFASPALLPALGVSEVLRSAGWFFFLLVLLRPLTLTTRHWPIALAIGVPVIQLLALLIASFAPLEIDNPVRLVLGCFLAGTVFGLVLVEQLYRGLPAESRWGLKPLCLALAAGYIFDLYLLADGFLFGRLDEDVWAVRGFVMTMLIPLIALSASRIPSWTVRIAVSREVAFHSTALAMSGLYLLVIAGAGYYVRYFGGDWGRALQLTLLFAGLLLLGVFVFSGAQRAKLRVFVNKHLFPYRYDYRKEWLRFTQALSSAGDSLDLGQSVIKALSDLVESSGGALWLRDTSGRFVMHARLNHPSSDAVEEEGSAFCRFIDEREWVVNLEEMRTSRSSRNGLEIPDWLSVMPDAWLVVPLKSSGLLVGFVVLNSARTRFEINWEVLDLLKSAQRQAASYLARMQTAEALLESRKFDSFNRMSAFVVHDLKNLVAQLSLMLKNAERHANNPEFQSDMLETVTHVETRMRSLMKQLQEKKSIEPTRRIDLLELLERVRLGKRHQRPAVETSACDGGMFEVYGHPESLERVVGHVVQNALEATPDDGKVTVRMDNPDSGSIRVVVEDNGCGMSAQFVRERLFRPFESSKHSGMGIGVYEAQQYVHQLGGSMRVESEEGRGTRVIITLPAAARVAEDGTDHSMEYDHKNNG